MSDERGYDDWVSLFATREEMADVYAGLLTHYGVDWDEWRLVNEAIVRRWSLSALSYIKRRAWRLALPGGGS